MENEQYMFIVFHQRSQENEFPFYCVVDKKNNKSKMITLNDVSFDSYMYYPQLLTQDNLVWFLGFDGNSPRESGLNPSLYSIDISKIF